jgi:signal transduction histidine kinase
MLRNLQVGTKLFTILAAPVIVILVLVTVGVRDRLTVADNAERVEQLALFASESADLVQQLQIEAIWSAQVLPSAGATGRAELDAQRLNTDAAVTRFQQGLERVDVAGESEAADDALQQIESRVENLAGLRRGVDGGDVAPHQAAAAYTAAAESLAALNNALVQSANDPELIRGLQTRATLEGVVVAQGGLAAQTIPAAAQGHFADRVGEPCTAFGIECTSFSLAGKAVNDSAQASDVFEDGNASYDERQIERTSQISSRFSELAGRTVTEAAESGNVVTVSATDLRDAALERMDALSGLDATLTANVLDTARELKDEASRGVTLYLLGGVGGLVVAFAVAVAVSRSVTVPLQRLTTAARSLSDEQLPALVEQLRNPDEESGEAAEKLTPIAVDSRDEIGQLAEAFNHIQTVTVDVAEEQSRLLRKGIGDIFVHLARRNQSLLDRQIEFIDSLERHERDPDQLDNLFKLDHLATRMRRNAESLLVLAGAEPPRRRGRPVPVTDVVRVAIGEVEDFARLRIVALDEATVAGNVSVDLAHMLSELMENATHFSPPETAIEVLGQRDDRNGYVLSITDRGIGMSAEQMADANTMLAHPPLVGLSLSRSLGFIVIGRLASRFDLSVVLEPTPNGGTTAVITLPYTLVEYPEDREPAHDVTEAALLAPDALLPTPERPAPRRRPVTGTAPRPAPAPAQDARDDDLTPRPAATPQAPGALPSRAPARAETTPPAGGALPSRAPRSETSPADGSGNGATTTSATASGPAPQPTPSIAPATQAGTPAPVSPPAPAPVPGAAPAVTSAGLARRVPKQQTAATPAVETSAASGRPVGRSARSPEEVRHMLSRYRSGLDRGRQADAPDAPDAATGPDDGHAVTTSTPQDGSRP